MILLCSDCFQDEGLKLDAENVGEEYAESCPNCGSLFGQKLDQPLLKDLAYRFFVRGSFFKTDYGGSPLVQFNNHQKTSVRFSKWLRGDVALIERVLGIGFFLYGPQLWMLGDLEPLQSLIDEENRENAIEKVIASYPTLTLRPEDKFYRLRINPNKPEASGEYDSSPFPGKGRFDSEDFRVLYASQDIEVCIHECRANIEDDLCLATLKPIKALKLLDLSKHLEAESDPFENVDQSMHFLFSASGHSYPITREIAKSLNKKGYDGLVYTSYFSHLRSGNHFNENVMGISTRRLGPYHDLTQAGTIENIGLFGTPILEKKVKVVCINKLVLKQAAYSFHFGPVEMKERVGIKESLLKLAKSIIKF